MSRIFQVHPRNETVPDFMHCPGKLFLLKCPGFHIKKSGLPVLDLSDAQLVYKARRLQAAGCMGRNILELFVAQLSYPSSLHGR